MILLLHRLTIKITVMDLLHTYLRRALFRHGVKVGPGSRDPGPRDSGLGTPSKFKNGTPGTPSKFKSRIPGPPSKFKSGTPHLSLMNSFFLEYLIVFYLCVSFK